jgi:heme O synthase-like polyprenyltransferase
VTLEPVVEHRQSAGARWLRERRLRIALLIALIESLLVLFNDHGWWYVVAAATIAVGLYWVAHRKMQNAAAREATWIFAVSQLVAVLVPVLWVLVRTLAIIALVLLALFFLAILLLDRPGRYTRPTD